MSLHFRNVQSVRVKTGKSNSHKFESTSLISWYELAQLSGYGDGSFSMFSGSPHRPIPVRCNWVVFARKMHSTTEFATTVVRVCVCAAVPKYVPRRHCVRDVLFVPLASKFSQCPDLRHSAKQGDCATMQLPLAIDATQPYQLGQHFVEGRNFQEHHGPWVNFWQRWIERER